MADNTEARTDRDIELLAGELHERARALNQLIQGPPELTRPEAASTILGNLAQTAFRLVQTAEQIDAFLDQELAAGRLGRHDGQDPTPTVLKAHDALSRVAEQSMDLGESFRRAQGALISVHGPEAEDEPSQTKTKGVDEAAVDAPNPSASEVWPATRDFPSTIEDVLPRHGPDNPPSAAPRSTARPPHPRRER